MPQLSRARSLQALAATLIASAALAAPALAAAPTVVLSAPSGHSAANPPSFAGTGGTQPGDSDELAVEVYAGGLDGEIADGGDPVDTASAPVDRETGAFSGMFTTVLADGTYTARARQRGSEQETGFSNSLVFTIGEVAPIPIPIPIASPSPTPEATPIPQAAAAATETPAAEVAPAAPAPYVCKSRRDFTKHVRRPDGTRLKVVATVEGRVLTSIRRGRDILVRVDLRGLPKETYSLHVTITRTRPDGRRVTTDSVTQVSYRTCVPRGRG